MSYFTLYNKRLVQTYFDTLSEHVMDVMYHPSITGHSKVKLSIEEEISRIKEVEEQTVCAETFIINSNLKIYNQVGSEYATHEYEKLIDMLDRFVELSFSRGATQTEEHFNLAVNINLFSEYLNHLIKVLKTAKEDLLNNAGLEPPIRGTVVEFGQTDYNNRLKNQNQTEEIEPENNSNNTLKQRILVIKYLQQFKRLNLNSIHQDQTKQATIISFLIKQAYKTTYDNLREDIDLLKTKTNLEAVLGLFKPLESEFSEIVKQIETDLRNAK